MPKRERAAQSVMEVMTSRYTVGCSLLLVEYVSEVVLEEAMLVFGGGAEEMNGNRPIHASESMN